MAQVRGTVTVDKQPLADGQIFFQIQGKAPVVLPIKDGAFEGKVEPGERKVEIMAYKEAASVPMEGVKFEPSKVNYLPERYNTSTTLKATVTEAGPNEFKFDLTKAP